MRRRSKGNEPPRSLLNARLCKHIHSHLGDGNFPTVATPRRSLNGAATYSSDESIRTGLALAPTDNMAATHSPGGCITPTPPDAMAATSPAGGRHTADDDDEGNITLEFGINPLTRKNAGHERPVHPTVMELFAAAIADLPNLEEPVDSYIWRETFTQHARQPTRLWRNFIASSTIVFARSTPSANHVPTSRTCAPTSTLRSRPLPPPSLCSSQSWAIRTRGF
jgi:hypothetical protein